MRFKSGHEFIAELNKFIENDMFNDAFALVQTNSVEGCIDFDGLKKLQLQWEALDKEKTDSPDPEKNYTLEFRRLRNRYFDLVDKPNCYQFEAAINPEETPSSTNYSKAFDELLQKSTDAVNVFISYAHEDRKAVDKLRKALSNMSSQELIEVWDDGEISPGTTWEPEIFDKIDSADIAILLISPSFTESFYCMEKEWKAIFSRHSGKDDALSIIPIYLMDGEYKGAPFRDFQWLPKKKKYIDSFKNQQKGFNEVAKELRDKVEKKFESKNSKSLNRYSDDF